MNKDYILRELTKREIIVDWVPTDIGPVVRFPYLKGSEFLYWNCLVPLDDESDKAFVDFVEQQHREKYGLPKMQKG